MTRAQKAGQKLGFAIKEMIDLMYQNKTALCFIGSLKGIISDEYTRRYREFEEKKIKANKLNAA